MLTLWYNLRVMKFHGILALSAVIAALASCADAGEFAHDAASLARALTAQDGADIMGTILFKPDQAFGEGLFFDN